MLLRSGPGKPNRDIPEPKCNMNRACSSKENTRIQKKRAQFMNFSFWPFLWFAGATPDLRINSVMFSERGVIVDPMPSALHGHYLIIKLSV